MRLVFFGTPIFAATILNLLFEHGEKIVAIVTKPDKALKRSKKPKAPPVKTLALDKFPEIPLFQPEKASSPEFAAILKTFDADLFVVAAYSEIFKENLLTMPKLGCINVHASILPKYRGAAPIPHAIMAGEKETGVTIMVMRAKLDAGSMLKVAKTPITEEMTAGELTDQLAQLGGEALLEVLGAFHKGEVHPLEQNHEKACYAPKLTSEDGLLHWDKKAIEVHNQMRAVTPKPGAWCLVLHKGVKKRLRVLKMKVHKGLQGDSGQILDSSKDSLIVACAQDALSLETLQLEGKKILPISEFLRGVSKKDLNFQI